MKRKFSDLFEVSGTEEKDGQTVYYDPKNGKLYVGETIFLFPVQFFAFSGTSVLGVYVLDRIIEIGGLWPLLIITLNLFILTVLRFRARNTKLVNVESFALTESYINQQKKELLIVFGTIVALIPITIACIIAYLTFSGFALFIISVALLFVWFMLLGTRQIRRYKIIRQLEKQLKETLF